MVLVYLPTKLGDFIRANVRVHIPAPWFAYLSGAKRREWMGMGVAGIIIDIYIYMYVFFSVYPIINHPQTISILMAGFSIVPKAMMPPGFFALLGAPTARQITRGFFQSPVTPGSVEIQGGSLHIMYHTVYIDI